MLRKLALVVISLFVCCRVANAGQVASSNMDGSVKNLSASYATWNLGGGPFWASNSTWNQGSCSPCSNGHGFSQTISVNSSIWPNNSSITSLQNSPVTISWTWPNVTAVFNVYSYPFVGWGRYSTSYPFVPKTLPPPKQLSAISTLTLSHDVSISSAISTDQFNVIYDFFLTYASGAGGSDTHEIEFVVHNPSYYYRFLQAQSPIYNFTDSDGLVWNMWQRTSSSPPLVVFWPNNGGDILVKNINALALFNSAISNGLLASTEWFNGVGLGAEPARNTGTLTINSLSITYN